MELCELVLCTPKKLSSQYAPKIFQNTSSLIDKMEQAYFSKGFM